MNEYEHPAGPAAPPHRSPWRRRLLLGAALGLLLGLAGPLVYVLVMADQALRQAFAETDALDPGWSTLELEQRRAIVPDSENAGLVLLTAKGLLPATWPFWEYPQAPSNAGRSEEELRNLQDGLENLEPCTPLTAEQAQALREELRRADKALATARKVADLPRGRYPIRYARDLISTLLPHVQDARLLGNLCAFDALLRAHEGKTDEALQSCRALLHCGRSIGDEPTMMSMLARMALDQLTAKQVERTLAQGVASDTALATMQQALLNEIQEPLLFIGARGERGLIDGALQAVHEGVLDPGLLFGSTGSGPLRGQEFLRLLGMTKQIRAALLRQNNQFVEVATLPVEQQIGPLKALEASTQELPELARPLFLAPLKVAALFHRCQASLRTIVVLIGVERFRLANARWPDSLAALVPAYLPEIPRDPFDGAPLRFRRVADGVVVYSVGPDGIDNGGNLAKDPRKEGADLGHRLWDLAQRRRTP